MSRPEGAPAAVAAAGQAQEDSQRRDSAEPQASAPTAEKTWARLRAEAALAGCTLHELAGGGFLLTRWGWAKELPDLAAVGAALRAMGVRG